jgi:hypothetical protein
MATTACPAGRFGDDFSRSTADLGKPGAVVRVREQWLALAVLLASLVLFDVAPPEFDFDSAAVPVKSPVTVVVERIASP